MPTHLHIDPFAGIAGDMFLGALIHAGLQLDDLRRALACVPIESPYSLSAETTLRQGIVGIDFKVHTDRPNDTLDQPAPDEGHIHSHEHARDHSHSHSHSHSHAPGHRHGHSHDETRHTPTPSHTTPDDHAHRHHVHYADMLALVDGLNTTGRGRQRARQIIDALAHAEAQVHGKPVEAVHFHEVGAVDSIVDMLGAAVALEIMGIDTISCGPLPLSRGFVRCQHGRMPVPAPATAYLLRRTPTFGVDRPMEMITPTGAAIVAALSQSFGPPPPMTLLHVGYGAGDRDDADLPNLLRVFIGQRA